MTITKFDIVFNQSSYRPGQMVTGQVILALDRPKTIRKVELKLKGRAKFHWEEQESYTDSNGKTEHRYITKEGKETYFKSEMTLTGGKEKFELPFGDHTYSFAVILPTTVPSSFTGAYGGITFYGKAEVDIPLAINEKKRKYFEVENPLNLNHFPHLKTSAREEKNKSFCCFCCASGPLTIVLYIPRRGYAKYESIPITVEVDNASNVQIASVKSVLYRKILWRASGDSKDENHKMKTINFGNVSQNSSKTWSESLSLAPELYPNLANCTIITISYVLQVEADAEGLHTNLEIGIPITIGDIPFDDFGNMTSVNQGSYSVPQEYLSRGQQISMGTAPQVPVAEYPNSAVGVGFNTNNPYSPFPVAGMSSTNIPVVIQGSSSTTVTPMNPGTSTVYPAYPPDIFSKIANPGAVVSSSTADVNWNSSLPHFAPSISQDPFLETGNTFEKPNLFDSEPVELSKSRFLTDSSTISPAPSAPTL